MWDCHVHVFPQSELPDNVPSEVNSATIEDYDSFFKLQFGSPNVVLVQPSALGRNNQYLIKTLEKRAQTTRGVIVLPSKLDEQECFGWVQKGVRGIRYAPRLRQGGCIEDILNSKSLLKKMNWHVQVYADFEELPSIVKALHDSGLKVVLDHFARIAPIDDLQNEKVNFISSLLKGGGTWLKFSGLYNVTKEEFPFLDLGHLARHLFSSNPERILWGSDWPHPNQKTCPPVQQFITALDRWGFSKAEVELIMSTNPSKLYE